MIEQLAQNPKVLILLLLIILALLCIIGLMYLRNRSQTLLLKKNEVSLNEAQQIGQMGNWVWEIETGAISWSDEIYRIFGLEPQQFQPSYEAFMQYIHPSDRDQVIERVDAALKKQQDYVIDHRIIKPDGSVRYVHERGAVEFTLDGRPKRMIGTVHDTTDTELARQELQDKEQLISALVEQAPDGIFVANTEGQYIEVNQAGCTMLGYSREEIIGKSIIDLIPAEAIEMLQASKQKMLSGKVSIDEWNLRHKDGYYIPVEVSARILPDGRWQGFVRDISERKKAEEKLRQAATFFDNTTEAILITDSNQSIIGVNQAYTEITGYGEAEVLGKNPKINQSGRHDSYYYQQLWRQLNETGQWKGEIWNRHKNGREYPVWENISVVKDNNGDVVNYVSVMTDISSIKEAEDRLAHLAHHDALTGLPNRAALLLNLQHALEHANRKQTKVALLFLDLDRFKLVNDTLGHDFGDELLVTVAGRLKSCVRAEDIVARLGGDEFTIVIEEISRPEDVDLLARKIIQAVCEPMVLHDRDLSITTSIGISIYPDDADSVSDLVKSADAAMYRAKSHGRATHEYYTSELTSQAMRRLSMENDMRLAIDREEFILHYQPQIEVATGQIVSMEALIRWQHPEFGLIMPDQFIHVAEDSGLISKIGNWVVQQAFRQASIWKDQGMAPLGVAVNMSGHQVMYDGLVKTVRAALEENNFNTDDADRFELEITESVLQSGEKVVTTLNQLREMGVSIAIDDFGTGYSSLSQLKHLPVDTLKIDRSFMQIDPRKSDSMVIPTAIISLGKSLGLKVVAEGIENMAQLKFLKEKGCDEAQGYMISKPIPPDSMLKLVKQGWALTSEISALK